jgi:hypothetical protein
MAKVLVSVPVAAALALVWAGCKGVEDTTGDGSADGAGVDAADGGSDGEGGDADATPGPEWPLQLGGTGGEAVFDMAMDQEGHAFLTGYCSGSARFGEHTIEASESGHAYLIKVDPEGVVLWARSGGGGDRTEAYAVTVDQEGNPAIAGNYDGEASFDGTLLEAGDNDVFVVAYDRGGVLRWATRLGGEAVEVAHGLASDGGGDLYVVGRLDGEALIGEERLQPRGDADCFVAKLAAGDGAVLWARRFGGDESDACYAAASYGEGIVTSGFLRGSADFGDESVASAGENDGFLARIDGSGSVDWLTPIGVGTDNAWAGRIAFAEDGSIHLEGLFTGSADFGGTSLRAVGRHDLFVAKVDPSGSVAWASTAGGEGEARSGAIALDDAGNTYVTGDFFGPSTFGSSTIEPVNNQGDVFVAMFDASGEPSWAAAAGGEGTDRGADLVVRPDGMVLVACDFVEEATFGADELVSTGLTDVALWRLIPE